MTKLHLDEQLREKYSKAALSDTEQRTIVREACKYSCGDFCLAESLQQKVAELEAEVERLRDFELM